jgi:hypothetical protein
MRVYRQNCQGEHSLPATWPVGGSMPLFIHHVTQEIEPVNGDLNKLDMELRRHHDIVRNHLAQLKIDKVFDGKSPPLHENIFQLLNAYTELVFSLLPSTRR